MFVSVADLFRTHLFELEAELLNYINGIRSSCVWGLVVLIHALPMGATYIQYKYMYVTIGTNRQSETCLFGL